ncbi:MAG: hypothetical protein QXJ61_06200, partial [Candidatus Nitrosocaldus sp.]
GIKQSSWSVDSILLSISSSSLGFLPLFSIDIFTILAYKYLIYYEKCKDLMLLYVFHGYHYNILPPDIE